MADDILEDLADHVNNSDNFHAMVHANINHLSEDDGTETLVGYSLAHSTKCSTCIITGSNMLLVHELHFDHKNWCGPRDTLYVNSTGSSKLLTYTKQDFNMDDAISGRFIKFRETMALNCRAKSYQDEA